MRRSGLTFLLAGLLAVLFASTAFAASVMVSPGSVTGGALVCTALRGLPTTAREFELLLVLDDGSAIPVSPELPAGVTSVTWRVPNVPVRGARLRLRVGGPGGERELATTAAFAIRTDDRLPMEGRFDVVWPSGPAESSLARRGGASMDPLADDEPALAESDDSHLGAPAIAAERFGSPRDADGPARRRTFAPSSATQTVSVRLRI